MNEINLRRIDLNLLVVFVSLMRLRNTTRVADALLLTQPAVSHALKRLRMLFGDTLFVRTSRGLVPTLRAEQLSAELGPMLSQFERLITQPPVFDPRNSKRVFRLGLPSALDVCLTPALLRDLAKLAPEMNLVIRPTDLYQAPEQLDRSEVDLAVSVFHELRPWQISQQIGERGYLCLFDGRKLAIKPPISRKQFLALPHVLTSFNGDRRGVVDDVLDRLGLSRRVVVASADFASVAMYLNCYPALAVLPEYAARRFAKCLRLTVSQLPIEVPPFQLSMAWHSRNTGDPAHSWFRDLVRANGERI